METFTSEFVYHYDINLPTECSRVKKQFIRKSIIKRIKAMKCSEDLLWLKGEYLYSFRPEYKDYVRIGLY